MKEFSSRRFDLLYDLTIEWPIRYCVNNIYQLSVTGQENIPKNGPLIVSSKHQYYDDLWLLGWAFKGHRLNFVAKKELWMPKDDGVLSYLLSRFFGGMITKYGSFPVDRNNTSSTVSSFHYLKNLLKNNEFVFISPEASRVIGKVGKNKYGLCELVLKFQDELNFKIPHIPVGFHYSEIPRKNVVLKSGLKVDINIGEVMYANDSSKESAKELSDRIIDAIALLSNLPKC